MEKALNYSDLQMTLEDFVTAETPWDALMTWENDLIEVLSSGHEIIHPLFHAELFDLQELSKKTFTIENKQFECGAKIIRQLNKSEKLALFTCSVGYGPTEQYKMYWKNNEPLKAYFTDRLGSIAVEKAMDIFQDQLEKEMNDEKLFITNRYSPGYCGWSVKEQAKLFALLPDRPCGITLTPSSLMLPEKSISGVIGIGKEVRFSAYSCHLCELSTCVYRKKRVTQSVY